MASSASAGDVVPAVRLSPKARKCVREIPGGGVGAGGGTGTAGPGSPTPGGVVLPGVAPIGGCSADGESGELPPQARLHPALMTTVTSASLFFIKYLRIIRIFY